MLLEWAVSNDSSLRRTTARKRQASQGGARSHVPRTRGLAQGAEEGAPHVARSGEAVGGSDLVERLEVLRTGC